MPRFEIVNVDTSEAERIEKPVQFKMELQRTSGDLEIRARQQGGWVAIAFAAHGTGRLVTYELNITERNSLSSLPFTVAGKWETA